MSNQPLITRARQALSVLRDNTPISPLPFDPLEPLEQQSAIAPYTPLPFEVPQLRASPPTEHKEAVFAWPSFANGAPSWQMLNLAAYVREGFDRNAIIYAAIMYKYRALSSAPLRAFQGDPENPKRAKPTTPLSKLLHRPNPHQSAVEFLGLADIYLNIAGNSFIYLERDANDAKGTGLPVRMWNLRPDRVQLVPGDGTILGYIYRPEASTVYNAMPIVRADMMHTKLPNPGDSYEGLGYGLSPMMPAAQSGDVDNSVTTFLKTLFETKTMLGGVLEFNFAMDDDTVRQSKRRWREAYGGVENWGEVAVLDQGGKFTPFSPDFQKLSFDTLDNRNGKRMLGPFGVPGMLIGESMDSGTYSNFEQADEVFWKNTFDPELGLFEAQFEHYLTDGDIFPHYDRSKVKALQGDILKKIDGAHKLWTMGTPRDISYSTVGLIVPETPGGKISYIPGAMLQVAEDGTPIRPAGAAPTQGHLPDSGGNPADNTGSLTDTTAPSKALPAPLSKLDRIRQIVKSWTAADKEVIGKGIDQLATDHEKAFSKAARKQFDADQREILALVTSAKQKALAQKATINWLAMLKEVTDYLDAAGADGWREAFIPLMEGVVNDAGKFWSAKLGMEFDVRNWRGEEWFDSYTLKFAQPINQTTSDTIHDVLAQGQAEGWSHQTMQGNLETLFKQWMDGDLSAEDFEWLEARLPPYRIEMIARTETMHSASAGTNGLFNEWGVTKRSWLATVDGRTRPSHQAADGQVRDIDEPFDVGDSQMMYPLDDSLGAGPEEIVDCRCAELPIVDE